MHSETTMRYHIRITLPQDRAANAGKDAEEGGHWDTVGGMESGQPIWDTAEPAFPTGSSNASIGRLLHTHTPAPQGLKQHLHNSQNGTTIRLIFQLQQMMKFYHVHQNSYSLKNILFREISWTQKDKYHIFSYTWKQKLFLKIKKYICIPVYTHTPASLQLVLPNFVIHLCQTNG